MRGQGAPISIGQAASIQLVACGAYAFALHLAATDEAGLVARLMRAWVAIIDSLIRCALRNQPAPVSTTTEAPCWQCHLMAFCVLCVCLFLLWTSRYWSFWSQQLNARLRCGGTPYVRVASFIAAGRAHAVIGAAAAMVLLLFPSANVANDWYMLAAPIAASTAGLCLAWFFVLTRLVA